MSSVITTSFSIISILLINPLNSQTGKGCHYTTCPEPGQVRLNAIVDRSGNFAGGCNCGCPADLYDYYNPKYCAPPKKINFDPNTLLGDCSCICAPEQIKSCPYPQQFDPLTCECACPSFMRNQNSCILPEIWKPDLCMCACDIGSVGGPCIAYGQFVVGGTVKPDCTCDYSNVMCPGIHVPDAGTGICKCPSFMSREHCVRPQLWSEDVCSCACPIGSPGGPCIINNEMKTGSIVQHDCLCDFSGVFCYSPQIIDLQTGECVCPSWMPGANECMAPKVWNEELCMCQCAMGTVGGPCIQHGRFMINTMVKNDCTCANV